MDAFITKSLTCMQITSKQMGVFDVKGMIIPHTARCKKDLRDIFLARWVTNSLDIDKC